MAATLSYFLRASGGGGEQTLCFLSHAIFCTLTGVAALILYTVYTTVPTSSSLSTLWSVTPVMYIPLCPHGSSTSSAVIVCEVCVWCGVWCEVCVRCVWCVCGVWCVVCGVWCVVCEVCGV